MQPKKFVSVTFALDDIGALSLCLWHQAQKEREIRNYFTTMGNTHIADEAEKEFIRFTKLCKQVADAGKKEIDRDSQSDTN